MPRRDWTREELLVAFNLYCKIAFGQIHIRNRLIIDLAEAIRRTPSVWNEFNHNWEALAFESERPLRNMTGDSSSAVDEATEFPRVGFVKHSFGLESIRASSALLFWPLMGCGVASQGSPSRTVDRSASS